MTDYVMILTTTGSVEEAQKIAQTLVKEKLAACVQRPIESTYSWEGKLNNDPEQLLLIKTQANLFPKVEAAIKALHSYATPEIICLPITAGSREYLDWISSMTRPAKNKKMPQP